MTYTEFKNSLISFPQLTEEQINTMYHLHRRNEIICVTGKDKSSLVNCLKGIGVQAVEVYVKDLIILDRLVRKI